MTKPAEKLLTIDDIEAVAVPDVVSSDFSAGGIRRQYRVALERAKFSGHDFFILYYMVKTETGLAVLRQSFDTEGHPISEYVKTRLARLNELEENAIYS